MFEWLSWLFDSDPFVPRPQCGGWSEGLIWFTMTSDVLIWLAYMAIPLGLFYVGRKRPDFPHRGIIWLFVFFIVTCGFTHLLDVFTFYDPMYRLSGAVRGLTAAASWLTVIALVPVLPRFLSMRSPEALQKEVDQRKAAEDELRKAHDELEQRVEDRTRELSEANERLKQEVARREQIELELRRKTRELETANAEMEEFAYVASHDLQEPLRKVRAFSEMLEENLEGRLQEPGKDYLARMRSAAERMTVMISDLLQLSRAAKRTEERKRLDLNAVLKEAREDVETGLKEAEAAIDAPDMPAVHGAPVAIRQLFLNLLSNSVKYRRAGEPLRVQIRVRELNGNAEITYEDNGIGFEQQYAEQIFKPFHRLHTRDQYPGTGVGLTVCRKIVERHGGTMTAEGRPGEGATFRFTLPTEENSP